MLVKIRQSYHDLEYKADMPVGVILEVSDARGTLLCKRGKAVEYPLPTTEQIKAKRASEKKSEEVKEEKKAEPETTDPSEPVAAPAE